MNGLFRKIAFPVVMLVISPLCSALGIVMTKGLVGGIDPISFLAAQLGASVAFLWVTAAFQKLSSVSKGSLAALVVLGIIIGVASICTILALNYTTASQAALIFASEPILIALLAWPILHERPAWPVMGLSLLGAIGVGVVAYGNSDTGRFTLLGNVLAFASTTLAALYTVWMRRVVGWGQPIVSLAVVQTAALVLSLLALPLASAFSMPKRTEPQAGDWLAAGLSGVLLYGLAYWLYLLGLQRVRAAVAGIYLNLVPVFALGLAFVFLGEILALRQWLGACAILIAVIGASLLGLRGSSTMHNS